jgi:hypothetical protein
MALALPTAIANLIETGTLDREFSDALRPAQVFRQLSATREPWAGRLGEEKIFSRRGLLRINTRPRKPGVDPTPQPDVSVEQWKVTMEPYNDTKDTHLPSSFVMAQNDFLVDARAVMIQAGTTINHVARNKAYKAYTQGNTYADVASAGTALHLKSINGFTEVLSNGRPVPVSPANPLAITVAGVTHSVVAATPDSLLYPEGPGVLTLAAAAAAAVGDPVLAFNRSRVVRAGGALTSNGLAPANKITLALIRGAVNRLRKTFVPTFADGTYHFHANSDTETQLFDDPEFQNLMRGAQLDDPVIRELMIARVMGVTFIRNLETPNEFNTSVEDFVPFDTAVALGANAGMSIHRPILLGQTSIMECLVEKAAYKTEGKGLPQLGNFLVENDGAYIDMEGIRVMIAPPKNRLQDTVSQTWAFEGDWGIPTDSMTMTPDMYKRAVVFEHA